MNPTNHRTSFRPASLRKPIGLALQGGGSLGAYTWGVLDALLARRSVAIAQLSGTSAGAINAAIVAGALAKGSPAGARQALSSFWLRVADPASADLLRSFWRPLDRHWRDLLSDWLLASEMMGGHAVSKAATNLLRTAIGEHVDIEAIRSKSAPALFVTVTNVKTGLPRIFSNETMSLDVLLASACLPHVFPAVELDGEYYWDGGYAGNPTLWPMMQSGLADDLILVQLMRDRIEEVPADARSIRRRVGEIVFNSSLVAQMQAFTAMRALAARADANPRVADIRMHRIGPPRAELFEQGSATDRGRGWLQVLHREGLAAGKQFIARHGADIGVRETLDVASVFVDTNKPGIPVTASYRIAGDGRISKAISQGARHEAALERAA